MSAAENWYQKGQALRASGDIGGAIQSFNQALKEKPDFADACLDLARLLDAAKQTTAAIKMYEHWLRILQSNAPRKYVFRDAATAKAVDAELAQATMMYERGAIARAQTAYQQVLDKIPDMPTALHGIAACLYTQQRYGEAITYLHKTVGGYFGYAAAFNTLGGCYRGLQQYAPAIASYRQATVADPTVPHVWANLIRCYCAIGDTAQVVSTYEASVPHVRDTEALVEVIYYLSQCCEWKLLSRYQPLLVEAVESGKHCEPFKAFTYLPALLQYENAKRWSKAYLPQGKSYDIHRAMRKEDKLRIGYLSSDFHAHATLALVGEIFEQHDRKQFEIYAYSCGPDDKSADRARVRSNVDVFRDIRTLGDQEAADVIRNDSIDILVEMKGYTQDERMGVAALRPAPIAVHYIGFPGTTGASFIDYFITDAVASPRNAEEHFTEKLIRLPMSYQINDRKRLLPTKTRTRAEHGLPEQDFVFCDFNSPYKITPDIFSLWMRLLKQVDGSVLWLYSKQQSAIENLQSAARKQGIDPARLVFAGHAKMHEHLERYLHADLCLDTFPVCSHTTASDALWCGVPLVTMAGESFVSRVAASVLTAAGLSELITSNLDEYEALALSLVRDTKKLADLKKRLVQNRMQCALFDSEATTRSIEAAYRHIAKLHKTGKSPVSFTLTPDLEVL